MTAPSNAILRVHGIAPLLTRFSETFQKFFLTQEVWYDIRPNMLSSPSLFEPFETQRVFETIADQIKELIYSGVFRPGDRLPPERQ